MKTNQLDNRSKKSSANGLILLVLGLVMVFAGSFMKIQHWPGASNVLITGVCLTPVSIVLMILNNPKRKK